MHVEYLLSHAQYHDSLLQQYRGFAISSASILVALGTGLTVTILLIDNSIAALALAVVTVLLAVFAFVFSKRVSRIISSRGDAVSYWLCQLIAAEQLLPSSERYYTKFQLERRGHDLDLPSNDADFELDSLTCEQRQLLVGRDGGNARQALDFWLDFGIRGLWLVLILVVLISLVIRLFA